jgi:putative SOS response-associated peptidase YedK
MGRYAERPVINLNRTAASLCPLPSSCDPAAHDHIMCGRVRLSSDVSEIKLVFSIPPHRPTPNIAPSWNVPPTDPLPIVRYDAKAGERSLDVLRWRLVPFWAKDIKVGFSNINAKAEGIEGKPAFREAFQRRRCLVPVDNFLRVEEDRNGQAAIRNCAG